MPVDKRQLDRVTDLLKDTNNITLNEAAGDLVDALKAFCEIGGYDTEKHTHGARAVFAKELIALGVDERDAPVFAKNFVEAVYAGKADWDERESGSLRPRASAVGGRAL